MPRKERQQNKGTNARKASQAEPEKTSPDQGAFESGKVGSDPKAAETFASGDDFGIPASQADPGRSIPPVVEQRQYRGLADTGEEAGARERGVGTKGEKGAAGHGSGGDASADFTLGSTVGSSGEIGQTQGPDMAKGPSDTFASGPPAEGKKHSRKR